MLGNVGLANAAMWIQFTEFHPLFRIMCFFFYIKNLLSIKYSQVFWTATFYTKCIILQFHRLLYGFSPTYPSSMFFFPNLPEIKTILNANDLNKISEVGSPLPVNYHTQ